MKEARRILSMVRDFLQSGIRGNPDSGDSSTTVDWDAYDKILLNVNSYLSQKRVKKKGK